MPAKTYIDPARRFRKPRRRWISDKAVKDTALIIEMFLSRLDLAAEFSIDPSDAVIAVPASVFQHRYLDKSEKAIMSRHIFGLIAAHVASPPQGGVRNTLPLREQIEDFLADDYIPEFTANEICRMDLADDVVNVTRALPGMRCAQVSGSDPQSGPLYCGKPAHCYGESRQFPAVSYIWCEHHAFRHGHNVQ